MISIDSKRWRLRTYNTSYAYIIQRATGAMRVVYLSALPSASYLAQCSEGRFDAIMREAFATAAH